jgi:hypothetical protein
MFEFFRRAIAQRRLQPLPIVILLDELVYVPTLENKLRTKPLKYPTKTAKMTQQEARRISYLHHL